MPSAETGSAAPNPLPQDEWNMPEVPMRLVLRFGKAWRRFTTMMVITTEDQWFKVLRLSQIKRLWPTKMKVKDRKISMAQLDCDHPYCLQKASSNGKATYVVCTICDIRTAFEEGLAVTKKSLRQDEMATAAQARPYTYEPPRAPRVGQTSYQRSSASAQQRPMRSTSQAVDAASIQTAIAEGLKQALQGLETRQQETNDLIKEAMGITDRKRVHIPTDKM